jgi:hypothetical protein
MSPLLACLLLWSHPTGFWTAPGSLQALWAGRLTPPLTQDAVYITPTCFFLTNPAGALGCEQPLAHFGRIRQAALTLKSAVYITPACSSHVV